MKYLMLLLLAACATTAKLEEAMQKRVGQNINSVIAEIGPPSQTFTAPNGDTMYSWKNSVQEIKESWGDLVVEERGCLVTYVVGKDSIIKSWNHRGNNCRSR